MNKELEALKTISEIGLSHLGYDSNENMDGEMEYTEYEEDDGTIEENYPQEISIIKSALERNEKFEKFVKIVKKCQLDIFVFIQLFIKNDYNYAYYCINWDKFSHEFLTETEFNLLKEMLEDK